MAVYFFILNLISNLSFCIYDRSPWAIVCMIGFAALVAYVESLIVAAWKNRVWNNSTIIVFSSIHIILIAVDYFLIFLFGKVCNQDVIDILAETNAEQTNDFIQSYISFPNILALLFSISLLIGLALFLNRWSKIKVVKYLIRSLALIG